VPKQPRSADESAGRRFKRRRRRRGKRGAVSQRRGRDKVVEGKERQKRDRTERPGDRKDKFERSRKRRPIRRKLRRQGKAKRRVERRDNKYETGVDAQRERPEDFGYQGPGSDKLGGGDIAKEIETLKKRRAEFSERRPEQIAERRGNIDPNRLKKLPGGPGDWRGGPQPRQPEWGRQPPRGRGGQGPQPRQPEWGGQPQPAEIGPDGRVIQPQPAPDGNEFEFGYSPPPEGDGIQYQVPPQGGDGQTYPAPQPGGDQNTVGLPPMPPGVDVQPVEAGVGFTPPGAPGPTVQPGIPTDAYGQPAKPMPMPSGPYNPGPMPGQQHPGQMNPRAAGMDRFARPGQRQPQPYQGGPAPQEQPRY
jgi:hypothetical protein